MALLIKGAKVIDVKNKVNGFFDVLVDKGKIAAIGKNVKTPKGVKILDAKGKILAPGFIDMHTHLRVPGREDEEDFLSGSRAAAKGGFTSVVTMANTEPVIDNQGVVEFIYSRSKKEALINVFCVGAATKELKGESLTDMADLKKAGAVAFSDDGHCIKNAHTARRVFEYAKMLDMTVISHCEEKNLVGEGVMNEGFVSAKLGFKGIPAQAESIMVTRDIQLAKLTGAKVHFAHVSCKESVDLIRQAKKEKIRVTAETCPHYFSLTDELVGTFNTIFKVNPPLRAAEDVKAIKKGLADGTIDCIVTDHAPHAGSEKDVEFEYAPFGMTGLETALGISIKELVEGKVLSLEELIKKFTVMPASILGLNKGSLEIGADADIIIFEPDTGWIFKLEDIESKSKNSPFIGRELTGKVSDVIVGGRQVLENGKW
ncbi:MAG: dihydroorotase [Candidatus Omnitrophota bacterium]